MSDVLLCRKPLVEEWMTKQFAAEYNTFFNAQNEVRRPPVAVVMPALLLTPRPRVRSNPRLSNWTVAIFG